MGPINGTTINTSPDSDRAVTARELISDALGDLAVIRPGQTAPPEFYDEGLRRLNRIVEQFSIDRSLVGQTERREYTLTAGQQKYGIGAGSDDRPLRITRASWIPAGGTLELPYQVVDDRQLLGQTLSYRLLHCDYAFPVAEIMVTPVPSDSDTLVLYCWRQLDRFADLDAPYLLPWGVAHALELWLALAMAPRAAMLAKIPNVLLGEIRAQAIEAKDALRRMNHRRLRIRVDGGVVTSRHDWNWIDRGSV